MAADLQCPKCRAARFVLLKPVFAFRRYWWTLWRWRKARVADVVMCEECSRIWEVGEMGVTLVSDRRAPVNKPDRPPVGSEDDEDEPAPPRPPLGAAIMREESP